ARQEELDEVVVVRRERDDAARVAEDRIDLDEGASEDVRETIAPRARLRDDRVAEEQRQEDRAERRGEDVAREDDRVDAAGPHDRAGRARSLRRLDDGEEGVLGHGLEGGFEPPADVGAPQAARRGERVDVLVHGREEACGGGDQELGPPRRAELLEPLGDGVRALEAILDRVDQAEAHGAPPSISSTASEQPRGVAPLTRPMSSISPPTRLARSEVWMHAMESRLARSSIRRM